MSSSKPFFAVSALIVLMTALVEAATGVDMRDPRRAVGREDDVRVDAEFHDETVGSGSALRVTYEVSNLSAAPIAIADVPAVTTFDRDSGTITVSVGTEIPTGTLFPRLVMINPGEKKTFQARATVRVAIPEGRSRYASVPRAVQIKVNVLRDLRALEPILAQQKRPIDEKLFELWINSNEPVITNTIPLRWNPARTSSIADASGSRSNW